EGVGDQGDVDLFHLPFVDQHGRQALRGLADDLHLAELRVMLNQQQRLLDDLVDVGDVLFGLPLVRELKQAVGDRFAAEGFVADDLQILAEVVVDSGFGDVFDARRQGFSASGNRRQRVVDLVNDAGGESANRGQLFSVDDGLVHLFLFGDVFADRDNVRNFGVVNAHRHFRNLPDLALALKPRFLLEAGNSAGAKDLGELIFENAARLARQDAEDVFAEHLIARDAAVAKLAVAVPGDNAHIAVNDVERDRQRIDDLFRKALLL